MQREKNKRQRNGYKKKYIYSLSRVDKEKSQKWSDNSGEKEAGKKYSKLEPNKQN